MHSLGAHPCGLLRHRGLAHPFAVPSKPCLPSLPPRVFRRMRDPSPQFHRVRPFVAAVPSSPGDPSAGADVNLGPSGSSSGGVETNGTVAAASVRAFAPAGAGEAGTSSSSQSANSSNGSSGDGGGASGSVRSSFRSVLRPSYIGELLFLVIGGLICGGLAHWTVGTPLRRFNPYTFTLTLAQAPGVVLGTPVRMKGVPMGSVLSATPLLDRVHVEVEVNEAKTIIPRNSRFELTQSGLIPAASVDISPPEGVSSEILTAAVAAKAAEAAAAAAQASSSAMHSGKNHLSEKAAARRMKRAAALARLAGPKDVAACKLQGVLVCHGDQLEGQQGGSMDELTARMLKSLRQGEEAGKGVPGRGPVQG